MAETRIDKWLWAVRIFKKRSMAADACKKNRVTVNDIPAKPAKLVEEGDIVCVHKPPITYKFKVLKPIQQRVGAKLVPEMRENLTPKEEYENLEMARISGFADRARGTGRPTKKERRQLDDFLEPYFTGEFGDEFEGFDDDFFE